MIRKIPRIVKGPYLSIWSSGGRATREIPSRVLQSGEALFREGETGVTANRRKQEFAVLGWL